jgi:transglutaminase-like putative cysteine protease
MREANWDEIFQRKPAAAPATERRETSFLPWEEWLTFTILAIAFMAVVHSIDSADWVDELPSLYPIGFAGLIVGYALARVRLPELALHGIALLIGGVLLLAQILAVVPGGTPAARLDNLLDRMYIWWSAVTQDGISTDPLPFIVLVLTMVWLGAYVSSWAVFRWRNPWLGIVPGGTALMWNISFLPGQFSYSFVVFIFAAVLLVMRVHVARKQEDWDGRGIAYPEFMSLSVLHVTFWVTLGLLIAVWLMPLADRSDSAKERWDDFTAPITSQLAPLGRVFISVDAKRPISVHNLEDALAFQGKITLNSREAVELDVEITPEMARFLRDQSYDEYTASGWKVNIEGEEPLFPGELTDVGDDITAEGARKDVTLNVTVKGNDDDNLFSVGQPLRSDLAGVARVGSDAADLTSVQPRDRLRDGDRYTVTGSATTASIEQLQTAGTDYPGWVEDRYLDLPRGLPDRVGRKATEVTTAAQTPYEAAVAIEAYLRSFPNDFNVPATPPGRDSVDYFLFETQRGYFDYHASAMAVMLRTLGVPARVASGYVIDPLAVEGDTSRYVLTERNAFAWPEVYFPGIGWVEFSPTPSQPVINRPGTQPRAPLDPSERGFEDDEPGVPDLDFGALDDGSTSESDPFGDGPGGGSDPWRMMLGAAAVGGLIAIGLAGGRFAWEYGLAGLPRPVQLWTKTQRLARWGRAGATPSETPREFSRRLRRDVPGAVEVVVLAAAYERAEFGHKELGEDEAERLESAWSSTRNSLLRRVLRLKPRQGDPG